MTTSERDSVGTIEDLHESATRLTGLTDFGADDYTDGLAVILESYARDADLTSLGRRVAGAGLRGALARPAAGQLRLGGAPRLRRGGHRAAGLRHRPAAERYHCPAPAAHR